MPSPIDPREIGKMEARIDGLTTEVAELKEDIKELLALANRSKGGMWVGMSIVGFLSSIGTWVIQRIFHIT